MLLRRVIDHVRTQNWTAVALDFVIVVAGVMLALWASQLVADRNARRGAEISQRAMNADLMTMAIGAMRRFTTHPCLVEAMARLNEAASVEDGASFTPPAPGRLRKVEDSIFEDYYPVGLWNYPSTAFDRAVATGAFDHMDAGRAADYAEAYEWVRQLATANAEEEVLRSRLSLVEMVEEMDAPTRLAIREIVAELDGWNQGVLNSGRFLFDTMHRLGITPTDEDRAKWLEYNELARNVRGDCVIDLPLDLTGGAVGNGWSKKVTK
ncbi:MAG: hypothetical protein GC152_12615 [Alphaproteobacteria bacterium]|nr:hypothetical protein [Alphaproteobacteria bacterium]